MAATTERLKNLKHDAVRNAIWDAAVDLFAEKGFEETTVEEIAQTAGVSRRSFFRYFSSKNDLMGQGIVSYGTALSEAIRGCPASKPPLEVVHQTVLKVAAGAAAYPRVRKIMRVSITSAAAREAQLSRRAEIEDRVAEAFGERCSGRAREAPTPRLLAGLTFSLLDVTFRLWFEREDAVITDTAEEVFGSLIRLVSADGILREDDRKGGKQIRRTRRR